MQEPKQELYKEEDEIIKAWIVLIYNDLHRGKSEESRIFPSFPQFIEKISSGKQEHLWILFCLLAETRDIHNGKGEIVASYQYIEKWLEFDEDRTISALFWMCRKGISCWKDLKRICHILHKQNKKENVRIINKIVAKMNQQVYRDMWEVDPKFRSNICKWIPREGSKYGGWLYDDLALQWCKLTHQTYLLQNMNRRCMNKCRRIYRKIIAKQYQEYQESMKSNQIVTPITTWEKLIEKTTILQGIPNSKIEEEFKQGPSSSSSSKSSNYRKPKNLLPIWIPSNKSHNFDKQVVTICQTIKRTRSRRIFVLDPIPRIVSWKETTPWAEIVHDLYKFKTDHAKEEEEKSDMESILILFQDLVEKMTKLSQTAKERMTFLWISDFNIDQPIHTTQMIPFWQKIHEEQKPSSHYSCNKETKLCCQATTDQQVFFFADEPRPTYCSENNILEAKEELPHMIFCNTSDNYYTNQPENKKTKNHHHPHPLCMPSCMLVVSWA